LVKELRLAACGLFTLSNDKGDYGYFDDLAERVAALSAIEGGRGSSAAPIPTEFAVLVDLLSGAYEDHQRGAASPDDSLFEFMAKRVLAAASPTEQADGGVVGETWSSMAAWTAETFGPVTLERIATRANEEMQELLADPSDVTEAADVCIVLSRYPGIEDAINRKMAVNRGRQWRLNGDGSGYHVKPDTPPATPIAGGFGSSPDGDTHRAADTAVVGGQIAWRVGTPPQDGSTFYGHWWSPCRWLAYKPNSEQARRGVKGRWQTMNEFGGWVNASAPNEWATEAQIRARQQAAPASDTTARYEPEASEPKDAARRDEGGE